MSVGTPQGEAKDVMPPDRLVGSKWSDIWTTVLPTDDPSSIGVISKGLCLAWRWTFRATRLTPKGCENLGLCHLPHDTAPRCALTERPRKAI